MQLSFTDRIVARPDVMFRAVGDESVILNLKTELYLGLDPVGTRMWTALTESPSVQVAYELMLSEFDVEADELRRDIEEFIGQLSEHQLIDVAPGQISASHTSA